MDQYEVVGSPQSCSSQTLGQYTFSREEVAPDLYIQHVFQWIISS